MTVSVDLTRRLRFGVTGLALLLALPTVGQNAPEPVPSIPNGAPVSLFPPAPAPEPDAPDPAAAVPADARSPTGMMVEELSAPDPERTGTLGPDNGGLPPDLWAGLPRPDVEALITGIPAGLTSPALRMTVSRLLLSIADPPTGGDKSRDLSALRVEALLRLGDGAGADALRGLANSVLEDEATALAWLERGYFAGDRALACDSVPGLLERFQHPVWQKWQVICQFAAGQPESALLGLDLLRDQGEKDDIFARLAESVALGAKTPIKGVAEPTASHLALILASNRPFPPEMKVTGAAPLAALARHAGLTVGQRLAAAEKSLNLGGLDSAGLLSVYEAVESPDPKALTVTAARKPTPLLRAQLLKALRAEPTPAAKAGLFKAAMLAAGTEMQAGPYGALLLEEARQFRLTVGFATVAPLVARLYLLQGEVDGARAWVNLAREDADAGKDEGAFARLWPLAAAHGLIPEAAVDKTNWLRDLGGEKARDTADGALILLSALQGGADALTPPAVGTAPIGLVRGAVLLDAVNALGPAGPSGMAPFDLANLIGDLNRAGLSDAARRIGVEALASLLRPGA